MDIGVDTFGISEFGGFLHRKSIRYICGFYILSIPFMNEGKMIESTGSLNSNVIRVDKWRNGG